MGDKNKEVKKVIEDYIQRKRGLVTMEDIHRRVFDEQVSFTTWKSVHETYDEIEMDADTFEEFLQTTRQVVEGGLDRISEVYFNVKQPENLTIAQVESELEQYRYEDNLDTEEPAGFEHEVADSGTVHASYIHTTVTTDITATAQIRERVSEGSVSFRVEPSEQLIIVESTYPPDVQRMKGVLRKKTGFAITVCGNITTDEDIANERVEAFRDSFVDVSFEEDAEGNVRYDNEDGVPKLEDIEGVKLYNSNRDDDTIEKIDYEGQNLANHPTIQDRQEEGYIIRGFEAKVWYNAAPFQIAFSGSDMMGYAKVEEIGDYTLANDLMSDLRERYMEHFGDL